MEYFHEYYSLFCAIYCLIGVTAIIILSINNTLAPAEIERGKFTSIYQTPAKFRVWEKSKFKDQVALSQNVNGAQHKSRPMSNNPVHNTLVRKDKLTDPGSVFYDQLKTLAERLYLKSDSKSNDQFELSQNVKRARYKSESISNNPIHTFPVKKDTLTDPDSVFNDPMKILTERLYLKSESKFNDQVELSQTIKGARYKSESRSIDLNPIKLSLRKRGNLQEPGKYNFLLLIIFYLFNLSHNLLMRQKERGKREYISPTKIKSFLSPTFSNICRKYSNYHVWGNSKYRNVYQDTKLLILAKNLVRTNSKYHNVCQFTKLLPLVIDKIRRISTQPNRYNSNIAIMHRSLSSQKHGGSSSHELSVSKLINFVNRGIPSRILNVSIISTFYSSNYSIALQDISNCINVIYNIQWSSRIYATYQEKKNKSGIQWPPEKIATLQTMADLK